MKKLYVVAILLIALAVMPAAALPKVELQATRIRLDGYQDWTGELAGLEVEDQSVHEAKFTSQASSIRIRTTNLTGTSVMGTGLEPDRGGSDLTYSQATLNAGSPGQELAVLVVPLEGQPLPKLEARSFQLASGPADKAAIAETGHVDSTREVLSSDVGQVLRVESQGTTSLRVSGSFAVSVWFWNFTVAANGREVDYFTGSYRENAVRDPLLGTELSWTTRAQVAQLFITDGWIQFESERGLVWSSYLPLVNFEGGGRFAMEDVTGKLGSNGLLSGSELTGSGTYSISQAFGTETTAISVDNLVATVTADGRPLDLGETGPIRNSATQIASPGPSWWNIAGPLIGFIGIMAVAVVVKGPAMTARFNRLESRFEAHDYLGVLTRIDPFTHKRRYQRRATFLKTVSLLSLEEYREAALYLETMNPGEAPEPATKAFLQACAAAGLRQDDVAIQHLSTCLRLDPSYREEVKAVPVLAGYLAYFSLEAGGKVAHDG